MSPRNNRSFRLGLAIGLLIFGSLMIGYSLLRPDGDGGQSEWTVDKALAKRQAAIEMHRSMTTLQRDPVPLNKDDFRHKHAEYERLEQERLLAIENARWKVQFVRWMGIGSVALGVLFYVLTPKKR